MQGSKIMRASLIQGKHDLEWGGVGWGWVGWGAERVWGTPPCGAEGMWCTPPCGADRVWCTPPCGANRIWGVCPTFFRTTRSEPCPDPVCTTRGCASDLVRTTRGCASHSFRPPTQGIRSSTTDKHTHVYVRIHFGSDPEVHYSFWF